MNFDCSKGEGEGGGLKRDYGIGISKRETQIFF